MGQNQETALRINVKSKELSLVLKSFLRAAFKHNLPITFWCLPHSKFINVMTSMSQAIAIDRLDLEHTKRGFIFSPFDLEKQKALYIQGDLHFTFNRESKDHFITTEVSKDDRINAFLNDVEKFNASTDSKLNYYTTNSPQNAEAQNYQEIVKRGIQAIREGDFQKVVPARTTRVSLKQPFDISEKFLKLTEAYTNAFVSLTSIPQAGTWLGATPELLMEVEQGVFKTVALAGTQQRDALEGINETAWTQKEIEEQAMVSRYIVDCFKKIRLRDFKEKGPRTIVAGDLLHLKTEFEVNMKETNFPELGTVMLELLHPTSAVAGMPKAPALAFLQKNEGFDRSFYSGFLGPIQVEDKSSLFVNLRCMQVLKNEAILYAGAGVTEDSNPEKELEETGLKFNTILNILNSGH
ncbi:MAG: isochorismate synthase [Roseivirga sp.]|jgi:isochorismate synthase